MTPIRRVWVTRAEPGAARTADRLTALGFTPIVVPLLTLAPLPGALDAAPDPAAVTVLALTSPNGVEAFAPLIPRFRDHPVFAVVPAKGEPTDLSHSIGTVSFRCAANQSKAGEEVYYGPDGAEQERIEDRYDFEPVVRNSLDSYVKEIVCEDKRGTATFPTIRAFIEAGRPDSR